MSSDYRTFLEQMMHPLIPPAIVKHTLRMGLPYRSNLTPKGIWKIEQNKPSLIAQDLTAYGVPEHITHAVLLARGVYKWLTVRRQLIKLKNVWRDKIRDMNTALAKREHRWDGRSRDWHKGYLAALESCRAEVRSLCHSERWAAPDFDFDAQRFLESMTPKENDNADS